MGALASSSPLLYFDGLVPPNSYDVVVTKDFQVKINSLYFELVLIFCAKKLVAQRHSLVPLCILQEVSWNCYDTIKRSRPEIDRIAAKPNGLFRTQQEIQNLQVIILSSSLVFVYPISLQTIIIIYGY